MIEKTVKACLLVIGDEVLEGSRQDKHAQWFGERLGKEGIWLDEVRIIPDDKERIAQTVRECSKKFNYVFTTGGLGPTHDDITTESVAAAFGDLPLKKDDATDARLANYYESRGKKYSKRREKMAIFPEGASLIPNIKGVAPGFRINENMFVFPGMPKETQPMFDSIKPELKGGPKIISRSISILVGEGDFAEDLYTIQEKHPDVKIGSYPFKNDAGRMAATIKIRATDTLKLEAAYASLTDFISEHEYKVVETPSSAPTEDKTGLKSCAFL